MVLTITYSASVVLFRTRFVELAGISCASLSLRNCMLLLITTLMLNGGLHSILVLLVAAMFI